MEPAAPPSKELQLAVRPSEHDQLAREGVDVVQQMPRLASFAQMLVHPEMAQFIDENMKDWESCRNTICLLKLGQSLCAMMGGPDHCSGYALAGAMGRVLRSPEHRQAMVAMMRRFMEEEETETVAGPERHTLLE